MRGSRHDGARWSSLTLAVLLFVGRAGADADHGWGPLIERLAADGISRAWAERVFSDSRMPPFDSLDYALVPRESRVSYQSFLASSSVARARACKQNHLDSFERAGRDHGVDPDVLVAILFVETKCGSYTGTQRVLHRVARLAMANEPRNVNRNVRRHLANPEGRSPEEIAQLARQRAGYLHDTFYPEVRAVFTIAKRLAIDPLEIRGSGAGAFGLPQFLPSSYLDYGVDADGNGRVSLFDPEDAIASCANYLKAHGWREGLTPAERRKVIWHYNRSDPYVDTILELASRLGDA